MKKAILYMRYDPKAPYILREHLNMQKALLEEYCKTNKIEIAAYCEDRCNGLEIKERNGLLRLLFNLEQEKLKADLLLFISYDTLSPRMIEAWRLMEVFANYKIVARSIYDDVDFSVVVKRSKKEKGNDNNP